MQIKRFEAKNMTMALRKVKNELGSEAVILSARSLRKGLGFFSSMISAGVEVTAAVDAQGHFGKAGSAVSAESAYPKLPEPGLNNGSRINTPGNTSVGHYATQGANYQKKHPPRTEVDSNRHRGCAAFYQQLLSQGVERGIASDLIDEIKRIPGSPDPMLTGEPDRQLCSIVEDMGVRADKNTFVNGKPKIVVLLGTAGVGKTTTMAKLAALQTNRSRKAVAMISIDNYGIAANVQLKTYARIIGIPLATAVNPDELKQEIKKYRHKDFILIDTPGINPNDPGPISEIKSYFARLPAMQKHLVMSAATKRHDLVRTSQAFQEIGVQYLLFTKLDESGTYGNIFNLLKQTRIPLSFLSCGRKVPDDIEAGSIQRLIDIVFQAPDMDCSSSKQPSLLKADRTAAARKAAANKALFVANKNSDVYHLIDCKWSSKIKPNNIIQFIDSQQAEDQNFLPCRSCNPDRSKKDTSSDSRPAGQKFSSYQ